MGEDLEGERKGAGGFGEGIYRGEDWSKKRGELNGRKAKAEVSPIGLEGRKDELEGREAVGREEELEGNRRGSLMVAKGEGS